jgi:hypothetical protein
MLALPWAAGSPAAASWPAAAGRLQLTACLAGMAGGLRPWAAEAQAACLQQQALVLLSQPPW